MLGKITFIRIMINVMAKKNKKKSSSSDLCGNRKAFHDYEILETHEAGMLLCGTEIKSLRDHGGSLQEAYVRVIHDEVFLIGAHIALWKYGNINNHVEQADRKLLLHRYEIKKLKEHVTQKGNTLVPLAIYLSKGRAKIKIGIAKGKKLHDKRASIKERTEKRRMQQIQKEH
jgi:SsrA-binding protein